MLAMLGPALNIAVIQFRREIAKRGQTVVCAELAANLSAMLNQLAPGDRVIVLTIFTQIPELRHAWAREQGTLEHAS